MSVAQSIASPVANAFGSPSAAADLLEDADLIARWDLSDNAANTTITAQAGGYTGVCTTNTDTIDVAGPGGDITSALSFVGHYITGLGAVSSNIATVVQNTLVFTISLWLKVDSATARYIFMGNTLSAVSEKGFNLSFENGAEVGTKAIRMVVGRAGGGGTSVVVVRTPDNVITDTNWHHVAVTCSAAGDNVAIYVDGSDVGALTYEDNYSSLSTGDATRNLNLVRGNWSSTTLPLNGDMARVLMYSRALSASEVSTLYGQGS